MGRWIILSPWTYPILFVSINMILATLSTDTFSLIETPLFFLKTFIMEYIVRVSLFPINVMQITLEYSRPLALLTLKVRNSFGSYWFSYSCLSYIPNIGRSSNGILRVLSWLECINSSSSRVMTSSTWRSSFSHSLCKIKDSLLKNFQDCDDLNWISHRFCQV